jgi:hypothetical protein
MKLNLGCGHDKRAGYLNVDSVAACAPDQVVDLEAFPWPWADNAAEEVVLHHVLEHLGAEPKVFLGIMRELYRVCAPDAVVKIAVPHPRHDDFIGDPTHVRPVTPQMLALFDRELNEQWKAQGAAATPLALYTGVDFRTTKVQMFLDEPHAGRHARGELSDAELHQLIRERNNIVSQIHIELVARKV